MFMFPLSLFLCVCVVVGGHIGLCVACMGLCLKVCTVLFLNFDNNLRERSSAA